MVTDLVQKNKRKYTNFSLKRWEKMITIEAEMKGRIFFYGMVLASPLQVFGYVPYLDVSFGGVLLACALLLWIWHWRKLPLRTPLEVAERQGGRIPRSRRGG